MSQSPPEAAGNEEAKMNWLMRNREYVGLVADLLALVQFVYSIVERGGPIALAAGLFLALVAVFFCGLSWHTTSKFWKSVVRAGLVVGVALLLYFLPALTVRLFVREPNPDGDFESSDAPPPFPLAAGNDAKYLQGRYTVEFPRQADAVRVLLAIPEGERNQFEAFQIESTVGAHDRTQTLGNLPANLVGVRVMDASPNDSVAIDLLARRKAGASDRTTLDVEYRYYKRTLWWEYKSWVYRNHR